MYRLLVCNHPANFRKFFYAMEQSSRGRYRIVYNVAQQEEIDYLVHFEVSSDLSDRVAMPILLKDVIRDLIANARKHTPPGGDITIGLALENKRLRFIVIFRLYSGPRFTNLYA
jgi:signal transduction histidine kinase